MPNAPLQIALAAVKVRLSPLSRSTAALYANTICDGTVATALLAIDTVSVPGWSTRVVKPVCATIGIADLVDTASNVTVVVVAS